MLEAIRLNSEEGVLKAWDRVKNERIVSREVVEKQNLSDDVVKGMKDQALLEYFTRTYNFEGTYFRGNLNKMTFIESCFSLGYNVRARQIQKLYNDHRLSMGLEIDPVLLNKPSDLKLEGLGKTHLSADGNKAKQKLQQWLDKTPKPIVKENTQDAKK